MRIKIWYLVKGFFFFFFFNFQSLKWFAVGLIKCEHAKLLFDIAFLKTKLEWIIETTNFQIFKSFLENI